ncbi:MAG: DNA topoisomerase IV [Bacteroidetes bacterium CG02_land_8_20_14_3_00_31_25]|nr:MAG: DNA topoisomerase IV [Bacteroidetes bacterium CG02_land_8_20_14_3_00_31_25]PIY03250.1 MAG: DNA topoisomerase IV [Bacteroidetes bacterium CG_4_10_14_3_um_filter_31_20]
MVSNYNEDSIQTLNWREHIRRRPGMYIGKLGDGSSSDDGIYVLIKETVDNSIDEFAQGCGKTIELLVNEKEVKVRDYGRGIPIGKLLDVASKMNTGAKYDSKVFKKTVGLNGVGIKAVNALSQSFIIKSFREGSGKVCEFERGNLVKENNLKTTSEQNGVEIIFTPDEELFGNFSFLIEYIESRVKNYVFLNSGLIFNFNGTKYNSKNGLLDLLNEYMNTEGLYPIIHLTGKDIEVALTHDDGYNDVYYSFVNGQHTTQGGTHLLAFREAVVKTIREFYKKDFDANDIRTSLVAAISIKIDEPVFESQTKTKLGSKDVSPNGPTVRNFIIDFVKEALDNFLHKNPSIADIILKKILESEKERKAISGIQKKARDSAKKASLHNKKLRDCRVHYNSNHELKLESTLFITEGDSASGSITKSRDVNTQAVFSLKGKPENTYGKAKKIVYENEELNLLQAALNIEEGVDALRYNKVIVATDADVDGMHIRLLLLTFFLQYFPDLIKLGHVFILQTPLFRVRNKQKTTYCYSETEKLSAIKKLGQNAEITRFKGLGEISPDEFKYFIGKEMRLDPVRLSKDDNLISMLSYYMGNNTPERQDFIIENLKIEADFVEN